VIDCDVLEIRIGRNLRIPMNPEYVSKTLERTRADKEEARDITLVNNHHGPLLE